jgi:AraC-like DNA-binding protein
MSPSHQPVHVALPVPPLRAHVSHYWLSLDNRDSTHAIAPDGSVDVVLTVSASTSKVDVFGTTTRRTELPLEPGCHYLGVRFRPGQSRHFLDVPVRALTDAVLPAESLLIPSVQEVAESMAESIAGDVWFARLDAMLLAHLRRRPARHSRIDDAIRHIEQASGPVRIAELAELCCKSPRQFERNFLEVAGLAPKLFSEIVRFRRACALLARSDLPLARIAADLGYADQSHFSHAFSRFQGAPPSRVRANVVFLQDATDLADHNPGFFVHA